MFKLMLFVFVLLLPRIGSAADITTLTVKEALPSGVTGIQRTASPVTVGIPLAEDSGITSTSGLGLTGVSDGQFRALAHWPNGNIKWVLADFQADVASAGGSNTDISLVTGSGNFGGSDLATDGTAISVNTGTAIFTIKKTNFNFLESAVIGSTTLVTGGHSGKGMVMRDPSNVEYTSANDSLSTAIIEENGPVRACIKSTGSLKSSSGTRLMDYTVRMHFYKGKSYVKADIELRNAAHDHAASVLFNSAEITVPLTLGSTKTATFARMTDTVSQQLGSGGTAYLFQGYTTRYSNNYMKSCATSNMGGGYWSPPVPGTCTNNVYTFTPASTGLDVKVGSTVLNALGTNTDYTSGYADLKDSNGAGVTLAMKYMAGYWPAGFEFDDSGNAGVALFSRRNTKTNLEFGYFAHETREIMFDFHSTANTPSNTLHYLEHPTVAVAPLGHYMTTKAIFGQSQFVTEAEQDTFMTAIGYTPPSQANPSFISAWRIFSWSAGGWETHTDYRLISLINWLRTGKPGYLVTPDQQISYMADSAIGRSDDFNASNWPSSVTDADPAQDTINSDSMDAEHSHWTCVPFYYYLTGQERFKEAALDYGEGLRKAYGGGSFTEDTQYFRAWNRRLRAFVIAYEFTCATGTCEDYYKTTAEKYLNKLLDSRDNPSLGTSSPRGRNLDRGYVYWDSEVRSIGGGRSVHSFFHTEIHFDTLWHALRVESETPWTYSRREELEDYMMGLSQFIMSEYYQTIDDGQQQYEFGFCYDYPLDSSETRNSNPPNSIDSIIPYVASRAAVFGYERTGNAAYLTSAGKLIGGYSIYGSNTTIGEPQNQQLMYSYFNPPTVWKPINVNVTDNGGGSWNISWTVPSGATQYKLKYSTKPIVDWLGFNQSSRTYSYSPDNYTPVFSATSVSNEPQPGQPGTGESYNITGLTPGTTYYFYLMADGLSSYKNHGSPKSMMSRPPS